MENSIKDLIKGKVVVAPLAGYTNLAYRKIMKEHKASLLYTEMVSAKGLIFDNEQTLEYIKLSGTEHPISVQLFGGNIEDMVKATKIVCEKSKPDIIDINMGCPIKKVLKQGAGCELLQDPEKVYNLVRSVKEASTVPVSVKIRAGIDHNHINCVEIAKACERAGASLIAIHGRTKSDMYTGKANLDYIKEVKENVSIPVIGNGDIVSCYDAKKMLDETGCNAVMIGRGVLGNPWLIKECIAYLADGSLPTDISIEEKISVIRKHLNYLLEIKPKKVALLEMRSHASWYLKGIPNASSLRSKINKVNTIEDFNQILDEFLKGNYYEEQI